MNREIDGWIRAFEVTEPQRHRKGFTVYKVVSRVFHQNSMEGITEIVSFKRFSEFKKLHKSLSHLHFSLHLKPVFPSFPDSKLFGRFDPQVIEMRRQSALELLEFAAKQPALFTSNVFVKFFENSVTNFTTVSTHHVIDSPTDEDNHQLPQPLEPNLNLSDDWSQRSGDNASDGSSYYSTPIHSATERTQNIVNTKTQLTEFDPILTKTEESAADSAQESKEDNPNDWLIYAIKSCDNETKESELTISETKSENNIEIPEPFAETKTKKIESNCLEDTESHGFVKRFSISCDSNHTIEAKVENDNQNPDLSSDKNSNQLVDTIDDTYLLDAAIILRQAQQHEENLEWEPAFESLKCAVGILLQGVVDESDSEKKASIRRKTFQYLTRAEHIYDTHLSQTNSFQPSRRWAPDSPFKSLNASLVQSWFGSSHELTQFKVIAIVANRVQIVVDTTTDNCFVIKVIYKSNFSETDSPKQLSTNPLSLARSVFPNDIPFMAQIYRIFKTEYALFLLLEYAKGGKLWDKITNPSTSCSPCPDCMFSFDEKDFELIADNAYSGRRLSRTRSECGANAFKDMNRTGVYDTISEQQVMRKSESMESYSPSGSLVSIESLDCDMPSKSYISLCNNYAFGQQKCSETSALANCKLQYISDSIDSIDSITECDSNPLEVSDTRERPLSLSKRQASTESLGISGLLAKARGILKNVDQTLHITKYMAKNANSGSNRVNDLRGSKSELSFAKYKSKPIEEVFHQMDDNSKCSTNRRQVSEDQLRVWLSQIVRCLQHLHRLGIIYCDLKPENLLLTEDNNICVSYKCFCNESPLDVIDESARERLYVAPELLKTDKINHLCDWWTFGVLAFEMLTTRPLVSYYPNGITSHTALYFPVFISLEAKDLINKLLQPNPSERLGRHGPEEITTHPFFEGINWSTVSSYP